MGSRVNALLCGAACAAAVALGTGVAHAASAPAPPASSLSTGAAIAAGAAGPDSSVPLSVPVGAFAVAVLGSLGAYVHSRRSDRRAAAMARHPAQRGVGRDPRRARR